MERISARRINVTLAVTFVTVLCLGFVMYYNTKRLYATENQIQQSYKEREGISQLQASLHEAEAYQRSYLLTDDEEYVAKYQKEALELEQRIADLESLTATSAERAAEIGPLLALVRERIGSLNEALAIRRDYPGEEGETRAVEFVQTSNGARIMEKAKASMDEFRQGASDRLVQDEESVRHLQTMRTMILFGHVVLTGLLAVAGLAVAGLVVRADRLKRQQAEAEKHHSEARLIATLRERDKLLDQVQDAVYLLAPNGEIVYWNEAARELYGYEAARAAGSNADALLGYGGEAAEATIREAVGREDGWTGERRARTRDGNEVLIEQRRTLIRDADDHPAGQLVIDIDVTERRRREAQERRGQRLESIGTLTGGIAHDLNNLLTPIIMGTRLLQRDPNAANRTSVLETIYASADRGAGMIKQLLAFTGGGEGSRDVVELSRVLSEVRGILDHSFPKTIEVEMEIDDGLWKVIGDATELSQVLMNLSINARDAMPDGGKLVITAENAFVGPNSPQTATTPVHGPHVLISVMDTGSGISPDVIDRIFDPFFTTKEQGKGTGLGLSTSLGIVRGHGGSLNVYSELGRGTQFSLYIPAEKSASTAGAEQRLSALPRGSGEKVLVVDDELMLLEVTRATLESYGFHALAARSGEEAIDLLAAHRGEVSVALVDMMMPGMAGEATIAALQSIDPSLPVIASSGLRRPGNCGEAIAGADRFLPKPYSDEQLLEALWKVMGSASIADH